MLLRTLLAAILSGVFLLACGQIADLLEDEVVGGENPYHFRPESSLEMRIAEYPVIVRATVGKVANQVIEINSGEYGIALKFSMNVHEYLSGTGGNTITAVWIHTNWYEGFGSRADAQAALPGLVARRDTTYDNREGIFFLLDTLDTLDSSLQGTDVFYFGYHLTFFPDMDGYSIHNQNEKLWLPSTTTGGGSTTGRRTPREYFLAPPSDSTRPVRGINETTTAAYFDDRNTRSGARSPRSAPTVTLASLKAKIKEINDELAVGGSTAAYRKCVRDKYGYYRGVEDAASKGFDHNYRSKEPREESESFEPIASGAPAGTAVFKQNMFGQYPSLKTDTWLESTDAALFETHDGPTTATDKNHDGVIEDDVDGIRYWQTIQTVRPLPAGEYAFDIKDDFYSVKICDFTITTPWTVTVVAPEHTVHEALFDPVTDGTAVAADSSNGQLEPATFTDANNASATIQRIEWAAASTGSGQAGTVKVKVSPHTGLAGHKLEFFELDGSVSLSLRVDEATVDATNRTLSWSVSEQPWHDGDELMLRIAEFVTDVDLLNVPATITQGQRVSVTVRATDLPSSNSYAVRLTRSNVSFGFDNDCLDGNATVTVPSGSASHSATIALLGCNVISGTLTATLMQGASAVATATAEVEVEASSNVTVTLSPREEQHGTYTDMAVEWTDPSGCAGRYFVGIFNGTETVVSSLGYHPAPATTSLTKSLGRLWDDIANLNWFVKVRCHASAPSRMTIVGQASLQSGLPSTP